MDDQHIPRSWTTIRLPARAERRVPLDGLTLPNALIAMYGDAAGAVVGLPGDEMVSTAVRLFPDVAPYILDDEDAFLEEVRRTAYARAMLRDLFR